MQNRRGEVGLGSLMVVIGIAVFLILVPTAFSMINSTVQTLPGSENVNEFGFSYIIFKTNLNMTCAKNCSSSRIEILSSDSGTAIQYAINKTNENGGGIVRFREGVYWFKKVHIQSNVTLQGSGKDTTTLKYLEPGDGTFSWLTAEYDGSIVGMPGPGDTENIGISDMTLECQSDTYMIPIYLCSVNGLTVQNVKATEGWDHNFYFARCQNVSVSNVDSIQKGSILTGPPHTDGPAFGMYGCQNVNIETVYVRGAGWGFYIGSYIDPSKDISVRHVLIQGLIKDAGAIRPRAGIQLDGVNHQLIFQDIHIRNCFRSIYIYDDGADPVYENAYNDILFRDIYCDNETGEARMGSTGGYVDFANQTVIDNLNSYTWIFVAGRNLIVRNSHIFHNPDTPYSIDVYTGGSVVVTNSIFEDPCYPALGSCPSAKYFNVRGNSSWDPHYFTFTNIAGGTTLMYVNNDSVPEDVLFCINQPATVSSVEKDGQNILLCLYYVNNYWLYGNISAPIHLEPLESLLITYSLGSGGWIHLERWLW